MSIKEDVLAFQQIALRRHYTLSNALRDMSGIGTLYSIGTDYADKKQLEKIAVATKHIPEFNKLVKEYLKSSKISLMAKVGFLSSIPTAVIGYVVGSRFLFGYGLARIVLFAAFFTARAGYNSVLAERDAGAQMKILSADCVGVARKCE